MDIFRKHVAGKINSSPPGLNTYRDLHAWSVDPKTAPDFWRELFIFENLKPGVVPEQVIQNSVSLIEMPATTD